MRRHVMCRPRSQLPPMAEAYGRAPYGGDRDEDDAAMAKEWQAQKDATVFLVDCGPAMARIVPLRADEDASQAAAPLRGVDLAFHLIETSLRNTCVGGRRAAHRPLSSLTPGVPLHHTRSIVSNDTDLFAVVLFNTVRPGGWHHQTHTRGGVAHLTPPSLQRESSNALHFEHVVTLETPRTQAIDVTTSRRIQQLRRLPGAREREPPCALVSQHAHSPPRAQPRSTRRSASAATRWRAPWRTACGCPATLSSPR